MRPLTASSTADANLWVYLSKHETFGYVGLAYVGVLCVSKQYSCSINEKLSSVVSTAQVRFFCSYFYLFVLQRIVFLFPRLLLMKWVTIWVCGTILMMFTEDKEDLVTVKDS